MVSTLIISASLRRGFKRFLAIVDFQTFPEKFTMAIFNDLPL